MDLDFAIAQNGEKWAAHLAASDGLDIDELFFFLRSTGEGDTPLEATANLMQQTARLVRRAKRRGN